MISSLLDNDYYACTMSNAIFTAGDDQLLVRYEFRNRTFAVPLASRLSLPQLRHQIDLIRKLRFSTAEIDWLRDQKVFSEAWLAALPDYELPEVDVSHVHGHLTMKYEGPWVIAVFWESILLALVNEMYYSRFGTYTSEGSQRLFEKIEYLRDRGSLRFAEFGTRRRFSQQWQHIVTHELVQNVPDLLAGTSNAALAMELGITPIGTMAHQLFMVYTAVQMEQYVSSGARLARQESGLSFVIPDDDPISLGIHSVLWNWTQAYKDHPSLMTVLPDTYGTDAFIQRASFEDLGPYGAFRQDSGDAVQRTLQLRDYANTLGKQHVHLIPSDSLDVRRMSVIEDKVVGVPRSSPDKPFERLTFGWGTNLTNDLGYEPLSIVIKPAAVWSNGKWCPCVKLSDDVQKITGADMAVVPYTRLLSAGW